MNKEQQIKELKKEIYKAISKNWKSENVAISLYDAGYRKQSEVVKAFVARFMECVKEYKQSTDCPTGAFNAGLMCAEYLVEETAKDFGVER